MQTAPSVFLLDELLEFILSRPSLEEIVAYKIPLELDQRLHELLDRNSQGTITLDERTELEEFLRLGHLLRMLKAKARLRIAGI